MLRLRQLREQAQLTQSQLGDKIGQTKSNISKYERGELEPNIQTLFVLANVFDVTVDYLLGKSEEKAPDKPDDDKGNNKFGDDIGSLSPESQAKAKKYIEMLKTLDKLKPEEKPVDLNKKT
jgi:transcriptional regulator with XRE-family HTH domain